MLVEVLCDQFISNGKQRGKIEFHPGLNTVLGDDPGSNSIGKTSFLMENEVIPYSADAYVDEKQTTIGYEISFTKYFYKPVELRSMYVDKMLYDIKAVQTLSRLNRSHPKKYDTFVLDFANKTATIEEAFSRYYRTTILSGETDPNKLYDIIALMAHRNT